MTVATGANEPGHMAIVCSWVAPGDLVVDVGANIGIYSVALAGLGARVVAVEPSDRALSVLRASISDNHLEPLIKVCTVALADYEGTSRFTVGRDLTNHMLSPETLERDRSKGSETTTEVVVTTLDRLSEDPFFDRPVSLVKIDAEGKDEAVLRGAHTLLEAHRPVLMVETWGTGQVRSLLDQAGFDAWLIDRTVGGDLRAMPPDWADPATAFFIHRSRTAEVLNRIRANRRHLAPPKVRLARISA